MFAVVILILYTFHLCGSTGILPWETYLQLGSIERPLGLTINESSLAHQHFMIGYLCLHSFMYDTAQEAFQLAIESEPTLVEAHIGRLLGHKQPLWEYTNRSGGLEVWNQTWLLLNTYNVSLTPLQSTYLNAASQWFLPEDISLGEKAFLDAMRNLTNEYPSNNDARVLLGLAYLNVAMQQSEESNNLEPCALLQARNILQKALTKEPFHPGCLHYLVHAFDIPLYEAALQGVPYAYKYGEVVVTASHAQHMPTHIWTRIGAWSLAQAADNTSIEVSLSLCLRKQRANDTQFHIDAISPLTLSNLIPRLNQTEVQTLLYCDRDNRAHSQDWIVYSYLQTGLYTRSISVLNDLTQSHAISPSDDYYLPFIYSARAYFVTNIFFWVMYEKEKHQEIFVKTINEVFADANSSAIERFDNKTIAGDPFHAWREALIRFAECIRLLVINTNQTNNSVSIDDHLSRLLEIAAIVQSTTPMASMRVLILRSEIIALRWCFNGSMNNCLVELAQATQMETLVKNDYNRPYILHMRASELFALYLLITHRYDYSSNSNYQLNNQTISIDDFPSKALEIYRQENETEPFRAVNSLGMARAYAQTNQIEQANRIYQNMLQNWSDSTFASSIDRVVFAEANNYILATKPNHTKNYGSIRYPSIATVILPLLFFI